MGCLLTAGITKDCGHSFGGLKEVLIGNFDELSSLDYAADGSITGVTMVTGATAYEFEFVKDTAQAIEELQKSGAASSINQTINLQLNGITQAKNAILDALSVATLFVIVKKSDNNYWFFGEPTKSSGLEATVVSIDSGTAQTDASAMTITMSGASLEYASMVDDAAVLAIV